jgi:hypothetical protein
MTIQDIHYDIKQKLNKIDSQQRPNLLIPEIDWKINEAIGLFVKMVAQPRMFSYLGFEVNQRSIDDIRTLVVDSAYTSTGLASNMFTLPVDYQHFLNAYVLIEKEGCSTSKRVRVYLVEHDDMFQENSFSKSSFEWEEVNAVFNENGLQFYTDGSFTITQVSLSYIKKHPYVHNAANFRNGTYTLPSGVILTGTQDLLLPEHTHSEIVDLAVAIISGDLSLQDTQLKYNKLNFNKIQP